MGLKLYNLSDSPPCLTVRMALKYLGLEYDIVDVDFMKGEQFSEEYLKKNPQGEVPVLDDNGFLLSESVAIIQYLADKYKVDDTFYPTVAEQRAVINHRLAFHMSTYYKAIVNYVILPACYAYPKNEADLKKLEHAVGIFNTYMERQGGRYAAGSNITIADLPLILGTVCLEIISFDLSKYERVQNWYENFKTSHADLWEYGKICLDELSEFVKNPPDFSHLNHPLHPTDRSILDSNSPSAPADGPAADTPTPVAD
ncbi:Glutathione S-transferase 1, isoform C [Orchesella cincta]|uniref:Glutathione S-transferase 1, isoform C n=1 Tax=Orchesella cincta TaxID=48709 RepID=A0A1D2MR23_ORCCI|nr:Glutathione S-transferase 1, isoform C [Orchesella cincta]